METYTKEQLVKAMQKYQNDVIENPDDYSDVGELDGSFEQSENSVNRLISFIDE